ncbi:Uncharacterized protein TCM_012024 [Theobroma cacao]|uniref:Uncharacterized protein n=1 Tax=Theobroma cacao TaxID=3641 RepID=A0A061FTJ8_THECC|nr:Uncharacterized protein TCM_012024 [Theobroma cacao]
MLQLLACSVLRFYGPDNNNCISFRTGRPDGMTNLCFFLSQFTPYNEFSKPMSANPDTRSCTACFELAHRGKQYHIWNSFHLVHCGLTYCDMDQTELTLIISK